MKKTVIGFIFGVILTLSVGSYAMTVIKSAQYNDTQIQLDGETLTLKDQCVTVVNDGTTWGFNTIPIRAFFESIGYAVDWDSKSNTILLESPLTDLETVAKNCKDSCVMIYAYLPGGIVSQGSGWVYNGYVITAKHVVEGADKIDLYFDDEKYGIGASIVPIDTSLDVAVLATYTTKPSVILGDSDKLREGENLVAITSPKGSKNMIDECIYSSKVITKTENDLGLTETFITNGSSGGAVFNKKSEIIGLVYVSCEGFSGAIPINDIKSILEQLK